MSAKIVLQLGRDTVIGFGVNNASARSDAFLTLLQTTSYRYTSDLPEGVVPIDDPQSLNTSPFVSKSEV